MTALSAPVADRDVNSSGRPDLAWTIWRQHRAAIAGLLIVFAAFALRLIVTGIQTHLAYASYLQHHCLTVRLPPCSPELLNQINADSWVFAKYTGIAVLPGLVGLFLGAPLVAREFETGAFRFSLTQGLSVRRQLALKLLFLGAAVVVASALLGALSMWDMAPHEHIARSGYAELSYWSPVYFNSTVLMLPAWAFLDFSLGALAGIAIKRVVPAMAVTMVAIACTAAAGTSYAARHPGGLYSNLLRVEPVAMHDGSAPFGHTMSSGFWPRTVTNGLRRPPGPPGSIQVTSWLTGPDGGRLSPRAAGSLLNKIPEPVMRSVARSRVWVATRHIRFWIGYQPASRYWLFQGAIAAILLALAGAAGFTAVRLIGRRM
jgi:hypothetical protein